ncbi:hypothetical protein [Archangium lansingense]|uniref:Uncharacterized protein n=1 Tax=Archangium lansingense TaxID=2995310 RepID=A0ABT4A880_9BACT|nr:hypothetical protein [Archangium lansinium]MCY1077858.1 hypothetical protein [Archangium lansinium]
MVVTQQGGGEVAAHGSIEPSPKLADSAHISKFLAESEALVARARG